MKGLGTINADSIVEPCVNLLPDSIVDIFKNQEQGFKQETQRKQWSVKNLGVSRCSHEYLWY